MTMFYFVYSLLPSLLPSILPNTTTPLLTQTEQSNAYLKEYVDCFCGNHFACSQAVSCQIVFHNYFLKVTFCKEVLKEYHFLGQKRQLLLRHLFHTLAIVYLLLLWLVFPSFLFYILISVI